MRIPKIIVIALSLLITPVGSFIFQSPFILVKPYIRSTEKLFAGRRYGPPSESIDNINEDQEEWERQDAERIVRQQNEFRGLVEKVMATTNPEHLPGLLSKNMELLLSIRSYEGKDLIEGLLKEADESAGEEKAEETMATINFILNFVEEFVEQTFDKGESYKKLLGKIIKAMTGKDPNREGSLFDDNDDDGASVPLSPRDREIMLDELMDKEKENFTKGFLNHIEGECNRISSAKMMTRESGKLLELMRTIQTRVLEEIGKDLGEAAVVLGQLMGYDEKKERLAVLDAGLTVRGLDFAVELLDLTEEALDGFTKVPGGGVDPELVNRVTGINKRTKKFIDRNNVLQ